MKTFSLFLFTLIMACSQSNSSDVAYAAGEEEDAGYAMDALTSKTTGNVPTEVFQELKIIKTGNLRFPAENLKSTHARIKNITSRYQGIIQADRSGKSYNQLYREMTLRIPSQHFQTVMDSIAVGVGYFDQNDISQQDVSEEFVDIQARLKAKKELENRYLELLKQAKNVAEILDIERELSQIREEIEAREGRLKFLENRVSYSTIHVYFYKTTADKGITTSYGTKMGNALKAGWNGVSLFFLGILHLWPLFVIALILYLVLKRYITRRKK